MFSSISWGTYTQTVVILLCIYYVLVLLLFYRGDAARLLQKGAPGNGKNLFPSPAFAAGATEQDITGKVTRNEDPNGLPELLDEVSAFIGQAGQEGLNKDGILSALRILLKRHGAVACLPVHKKEIRQALIRGCADHCSVTLQEKDLEAVWPL